MAPAPRRPASHRPRSYRWQWALLIGMALGTVMGLVACAAPPRPPGVPMAPLPAASTPSVQRVAQQVTVAGARGPLGPQRREQVLQNAAAQGKAELLQRQLAAMSALGDVDLYAGNEAKLLIDGPATFAAMFAAIAKARHQVLLESYIIEDAEISHQLADLLAERSAKGVQVAVIYDSVGSLGTQQAFFDRLHAAGVATCAFNPVNPWRRPGYFDISHRDHRKILIVDSDLGFTGGINISAVYSSGSSGSFGRKKSAPERKPGEEAGWRDTQIQLRGPAVRALDQLVRETWEQQGCEGTLKPAPAVAMPAAAPGQQLMRIIPSTPDDKHNRIYTLLLGSIHTARRSVHLTMAYFAPGREMVDALCDAARRGVDVQLILPSKSDFSPVLHAGRSHYQRLLDAGVKIHELQDAVLHAKTAVIDGVVSTVGSSNMDWRSFVHNNEVNAVVLGEDFGAAMTRMFEQDLAASQPVDPAQWPGRGVWQRGKEALARLFERWW